jgi:hypothetical protein
MTETSKKKVDRLLCCGYSGIEKMDRYWQKKAKKVLLKTWMIVSPIALIALVWANFSNLIAFESQGGKVTACILYAVFGIGTLADLGYCFIKAWDYWIWHEFKTAKKISRWTEKATIVFSETASPVFMAWLIGARQSGELAAFSNDAKFGLFWIFIVSLIICICDGYLLFGDAAAGIWNNRESNLIGTAKRTLIRGIGLAMILSGKCKRIGR